MKISHLFYCRQCIVVLCLICYSWSGLVQRYYTEKWRLSIVLIGVICCYNSTKYEVNFVILFLLVEKILALNLLNCLYLYNARDTHTHTHTRLTALCPGLPG